MCEGEYLDGSSSSSESTGLRDLYKFSRRVIVAGLVVLFCLVSCLAWLFAFLFGVCCFYSSVSHIFLKSTSPWRVRYLSCAKKRGRVPRDRFLAGIIIDDMIFIEKTLKTLVGKPAMSKEARKRIAATEAQYSAVGLETHSKKSFQDSVEATFWGCHVDGHEGLVRANPQRVIPMMVIVNRMLQLVLHQLVCWRR